jgi:aryl-alcohol dehydrogenase-like predicted oxidoreductase
VDVDQLMELRRFGSTGLTVPAIGMGTWRTFDVRGAAAEHERRAIVDTALASGITLFDTSPMYGDAERVLARAIEGRRDAAIVADKVWTSSSRQGREQVRRAMEWYGGRMEIYQIHNLVSWREHLPMLEELHSRHAVAVVGATHYQHRAFGELLTVMESGRVGMIQIPYNAADRLVEREVLPRAQALGLGVLIMQPLGTGSLVRRAPPALDLERLTRYGVTTWAQALLKWVVSDRRVHCTIPATSDLAHVRENAAAGDAPWFDEETREYVATLTARL